MVPRYDASPADVQHPDATYAILGDRRRRQAVEILSERDSPTAVTDLAAAIASGENGSEEAVDEIAALLHHVHLPRLAAAGVVEYDATTNTVDPTRSGTLDELSRMVDEVDRAIA